MPHASDLTPFQLLKAHTNTLYCVDVQGKLAAVNEIGEPSAPLFYLGRSAQGNVWHCRADLPSSVAEAIDACCRAEPLVSDFTRPPEHAAALRDILAEYAGQRRLHEYRGPAYWLPDHAAPRTPAAVVAITAANADLCAGTFAWLLPMIHDPQLGPVAATVVDNQAVTLCFCSRRPGQATEAGVETLPAYRGRGYAAATVAAWAAAVRAMGCMPLYSTSWDNLASQAVARKLGAVMYGEDWSVRGDM